MTVINFAVAVAVQRMTRRNGNGLLLAAGLAATTVGMVWLSRLSADTSYLVGVALPMVLSGAGQGAALSPLTASAMSGVAPEEARAASGMVNVAHQLGGSLGLGILVTIAASVAGGGAGAQALLASRASLALTAAVVMLAIALVLVVVLIVRPPRARRLAGRDHATEATQRDRMSLRRRCGAPRSGSLDSGSAERRTVLS